MSFVTNSVMSLPNSYSHLGDIAAKGSVANFGSTGPALLQDSSGRKKYRLNKI